MSGASSPTHMYLGLARTVPHLGNLYCAAQATGLALQNAAASED